MFDRQEDLPGAADVPKMDDNNATSDTATTMAEAAEDEEEEYDPPINPNWRAVFKSRTTIFDRPNRCRAPQRSLAELEAARAGWSRETRMLQQMKYEHQATADLPCDDRSKWKRRFDWNVRCERSAKGHHQYYERRVREKEEEMARTPIGLVMAQANVSREKAAKALEENGNDVVDAIMALCI